MSQQLEPANARSCLLLITSRSSRVLQSLRRLPKGAKSGGGASRDHPVAPLFAHAEAAPDVAGFQPPHTFPHRPLAGGREKAFGELSLPIREGGGGRHLSTQETCDE